MNFLVRRYQELLVCLIFVSDLHWKFEVCHGCLRQAEGKMLIHCNGNIVISRFTYRSRSVGA